MNLTVLSSGSLNLWLSTVLQGAMAGGFKPLRHRRFQGRSLGKPNCSDMYDGLCAYD